jgi:hypothetical protein
MRNPHNAQINELRSEGPSPKRRSAANAQKRYAPVQPPT